MGPHDAARRYPDPFTQVKDAATSTSSGWLMRSSLQSDVEAGHFRAVPVDSCASTIKSSKTGTAGGWRFAFSVLINVNTALLNLLPFPVLDGGHITLAIIEGIRRKPINVRVLEFVQTACALAADRVHALPDVLRRR